MADEELRSFKRGTGALMVSGSYGRFTLGLETHTIAQLGYGMDARAVPVEALRLMGTCPPIYLAERTLTGIVRRPDLYTVKHEDAALVAEVEAWLWAPGVLDRLCAAAARGFAYGSVTTVLDWKRETLRIEVPTGGKAGNGTKLRAKTLVDHTHFAMAHEVHPDETLFDLDSAGEIVRVHACGSAYNVERTAPWIWDPEFGTWLGQGARRRAWRDYCEWLIVTVLRDKYLEHSVDAPRIGWVPDGEFTLEDGTKKKNAEHVKDLLEDLRGTGNLVLPGAISEGMRKYHVEQMKIEDRHDTWEQAISRHEANMFLAYLVAPQLQGLDEAAAGASKTLDGTLRENVEDVATWIAAGLSRLVAIVHKANHDPAKVAAPTIVPTDVGKAAAKKLYQEVLRLANQAARGEIAMRTDMPALLDKLGIPLREPPADWEVGEAEDAPQNGRPQNPTGDRADRRDNATTTDGEEDTGGEDQVREDAREEQPA